MTEDINLETFAHFQRFPQSVEDEPRPPFAIELTDYLLVGVSLDRRAVRSLVPQSLHLPPRVHGFIATGHAPRGWGITPFSNFYLALAVDEIVSPDGTPAMFRPLNIYSERAGKIFRKHYNSLFKFGSHRFTQDNGVWTADIAADDGLALRLAVRRNPGAVATMISGVHHYLGQDIQGEVTSFHVSYSADATAAEVIDFEVSGGDSRFHLSPEFTWASQIGRLAVTIGEPRGSPFAAADPNPKATELTALLGRIGLAAVCMSRDGLLLSVNPAAERILAEDVNDGRIVARRPTGQRSVDPAFLAKLRRAGRPVALLPERKKDGLPTIVQAFPISRDLIEEDAFLILFRDPGGRDPVDPKAVLELLGLTPAEARLAAIMGTGNSVATSAQQLGITTNTARKTLQVVYGKLQIGRQSELARIVARIATGADETR